MIFEREDGGRKKAGSTKEIASLIPGYISTENEYSLDTAPLGYHIINNWFSSSRHQVVRAPPDKGIWGQFERHVSRRPTRASLEMKIASG